MEKILPSIQFNVINTGVTISSDRLKTARFVPFDSPGQCRMCRSDHLTIDHCVTMEGIHLYSNRFKAPKFINFDVHKEFPKDCFFSVRCRGRIFKIPHMMHEPEESEVEEKKMKLEATENLEEKKKDSEKAIENPMEEKKDEMKDS
jgi:hypothetical protein